MTLIVVSFVASVIYWIHLETMDIGIIRTIDIDHTDSITLNMNVKAQNSLKYLRRAVLIYEPDNIAYLDIFTHFLFASWLYLLRVQREYNDKYNLNAMFATNIIDIIIVIPLNYSQELPVECQLIDNMNDDKKKYIYDKTRNTSLCMVLYSNNSLHKDLNYNKMYLETYPYLHSIDCILSFQESFPSLYFSYNYILKTDDDTFLYPFFLYQFPANSREFITGHGGRYMGGNGNTKLQILNISKMLNLSHCEEGYCFNIGSTWYAEPGLIINVARLTIKVNVYLIWLFDTSQTPYHLWKDGWFRGVTSMYASDIAINDQIITKQNKSDIHYNRHSLILDEYSQRHDDINFNNKIIHVHVWKLGGNDNVFSKGYIWNIKMREYLGNITTFLNEIQYNNMTVALWCTAIAFDLYLNLSVNLFDIDTLLLEKNYIDNITINRNIKKIFVKSNSSQILTWNKRNPLCRMKGEYSKNDTLNQSGNNSLVFKDVKNWGECNFYCNKYNENITDLEKKCNGWTYWRIGKQCFPKNAKFDRLTIGGNKNDYFSGPVHCSLLSSNMI